MNYFERKGTLFLGKKGLSKIKLREMMWHNYLAHLILYNKKSFVFRMFSFSVIYNWFNSPIDIIVKFNNNYCSHTYWF